MHFRLCISCQALLQSISSNTEQVPGVIYVPQTCHAWCLQGCIAFSLPSLGTVLCCDLVMITDHCQCRVREAIVSGGGECATGGFLGGLASHVICSPTAASKWLAMGTLHSYSPASVLPLAGPLFVCALTPHPDLNEMKHALYAKGLGSMFLHRTTSERRKTSYCRVPRFFPEGKNMRKMKI